MFFIEGFSNQPYLQRKPIKWSDFLNTDADSHKLKADENISGWALSKMGVTSLVVGP